MAIRPPLFSPPLHLPPSPPTSSPFNPPPLLIYMTGVKTIATQSGGWELRGGGGLSLASPLSQSVSRAALKRFKCMLCVSVCFCVERSKRKGSDEKTENANAIWIYTHFCWSNIFKLHQRHLLSYLYVCI